MDSNFLLNYLRLIISTAVAVYTLYGFYKSINEYFCLEGRSGPLSSQALHPQSSYLEDTRNITDFTFIINSAYNGNSSSTNLLVTLRNGSVQSFNGIFETRYKAGYTYYRLQCQSSLDVGSRIKKLSITDEGAIKVTKSLDFNPSIHTIECSLDNYLETCNISLETQNNFLFLCFVIMLFLVFQCLVIMTMRRSNLKVYFWMFSWPFVKVIGGGYLGVYGFCNPITRMPHKVYKGDKICSFNSVDNLEGEKIKIFINLDSEVILVLNGDKITVNEGGVQNEHTLTESQVVNVSKYLNIIRLNPSLCVMSEGHYLKFNELFQAMSIDSSKYIGVSNSLKTLWVLGDDSEGFLREFFIKDMKLQPKLIDCLIYHNKEFFGKVISDCIFKVVQGKTNFYNIPKKVGNSQWKLYVSDCKEIYKFLGYENGFFTQCKLKISEAAKNAISKFRTSEITLQDPPLKYAKIVEHEAINEKNEKNEKNPSVELNEPSVKYPEAIFEKKIENANVDTKMDEKTFIFKLRKPSGNLLKNVHKGSQSRCSKPVKQDKEVGKVPPLDDFNKIYIELVEKYTKKIKPSLRGVPIGNSYADGKLNELKERFIDVFVDDVKRQMISNSEYVRSAFFSVFKTGIIPKPIMEVSDALLKEGDLMVKLFEELTDKDLDYGEIQYNLEMVEFEKKMSTYVRPEKFTRSKRREEYYDSLNMPVKPIRKTTIKVSKQKIQSSFDQFYNNLKTECKRIVNDLFSEFKSKLGLIKECRKSLMNIGLINNSINLTIKVCYESSIGMFRRINLNQNKSGIKKKREEHFNGGKDFKKVSESIKKNELARAFYNSNNPFDILNTVEEWGDSGSSKIKSRDSNNMSNNIMKGYCRFLCHNLSNINNQFLNESSKSTVGEGGVDKKEDETKKKKNNNKNKNKKNNNRRGNSEPENDYNISKFVKIADCDEILNKDSYQSKNLNEYKVREWGEEIKKVNWCCDINEYITSSEEDFFRLKLIPRIVDDLFGVFNPCLTTRS